MIALIILVVVCALSLATAMFVGQCFWQMGDGMEEATRILTTPARADGEESTDV